jgi:hypothetical protein
MYTSIYFLIHPFFLNILKAFNSSANNNKYNLFLLNLIGILLMKIENRVGPRTAPCGTPVKILLLLVAVPITKCFLKTL